MSTDPSQPTTNALPGKRVEALGACALIALTALLGLCWISDLPLLGYDAYPLIASSQMEGLGDIWRILSMELMDGRYPDGHFHRPLVQLSFALDRTLHGLEPKGYHLTNLIACATSGVLIFGLARRVTGIGIWSACLAGLIFVAHPLQAEVLPFAARRADNLALCLILAVLALQVRPSTSLSWWRGLACGVLAWCAFAAKETGAVVALLAPIMLVIEAQGTLSERTRSALRRVWPTLLGVGLGVLARQLVLGGLAGHSDSSLLAGLSLPASEYLWRLLYSQPWLGWGSGGMLIIWGLFAALVFKAWKSKGGGAGFLLAWLFALLAVSGLAGRVHDWYALLFVPPFAILLGAVIDDAWNKFREERKPAGLIPGILAVGLGISFLACGPLTQRYSNLIDGSKMLTQSLAQVDRLLEGAQEGSSARLNPWIPFVQPHSDGSELRGVALAADYSLQAYVELQRPDLKCRVRRFESATAPNGEQLWTLELVQQPLPSWIRQH